MSTCTKRKSTVRALTAVGTLVFCPCVFSYGDWTHATIVWNAMHYMYDGEAGAGYEYPDGWSQEWDRYVAFWWSGRLGTSDAEILARFKDVRNLLAKECVDVDYYLDLALYTNSETCAAYFGVDTKYHIEDDGETRYFTSLSHFMNAQHGEGYWDTNGYYYHTSNQSGKDKKAMASFWVTLCDVEIDNSPGYSPAYWWYSDPDRKVSFAVYQENAEKEIQHTRFMPIDNMARRGYDWFVHHVYGYPHRDEALRLLGRVFHAVQDATVPHHVLGLMGEGHGEYEDYVSVQYVGDYAGITKPGFYNPALVREHLNDRDFLRTDQDFTVNQIVTELARYVKDREIDKWNNVEYEDGKTVFHPGTNSFNRVRELVHLAIAANVVILRKAYVEWGIRHDALYPDYPGYADMFPDRPPSPLPPEEYWAPPPTDLGLELREEGILPELEEAMGMVRDYKTEDPSTFYPPDFLSKVDVEQRNELIVCAEGLRDAISSYCGRELTQSEVLAEMTEREGRLTAVFKATIAFEEPPVQEDPGFASYEAFVTWDDGLILQDRIPPVGDRGRRQYRLPTHLEVDSEEMFAAYVRERSIFALCMRLHESVITKALVSFDLARDPEPEVYDRLVGIYVSLGQEQQDALEALTGSTSFRRGDANASGTIDIADAIFMLTHLFAKGPVPTCRDAGDANDDGSLDIADAIALLSHLFASAGPLKPPFGNCGVDPTNDALDCLEFAPCK